MNSYRKSTSPRSGVLRFLETVRLQDGSIQNADLHFSRMQNTLSHFFPDSKFFDPFTSLTIPRHARKGRVRMRIVYGDTILKIEFFDYHIKNIQRLQPILLEHFDYSFKYEDRSFFDSVSRSLPEDTEPLFIQNGLVTDTTYSNVLFETHDRFDTPSSPLLAGTKRRQLLETHKPKNKPFERGTILEKPVVEKKIPLPEIRNYQRIHLINAMMDPGELVLPIDRIHPESWF